LLYHLTRQSPMLALRLFSSTTSAPPYPWRDTPQTSFPNPLPETNLEQSTLTENNSQKFYYRSDTMKPLKQRA
jgi:hypothetical protein